jgi:hypothetical protein
MIEKNFGWWPHNSVVDARITRAEPLATYEQSIAVVKNSPRSYDGWFYPPLSPVGSRTTETKPPPEVVTRSFTLPVTHRIVGTEAWMEKEYLDFAIVLIGMVDGMRLIPEPWVHFYKAPTERNKLSDLVCDACEIAEVVFGATTWWKNAPLKQRRSMLGAVHWYCFSGLYEHEFEEFGAKYIVLDTLYWIHHRRTGQARVSHAKRPSILANAYGLEVPSWAVMQNDSCRLAEIRNALFHEGRFGERPIGFGHPPETSLTLELGAFLTRLLIAMLGIECAYIKTPTNTRSMHAIDLLQRNLS